MATTIAGTSNTSPSKDIIYALLSFRTMQSIISRINEHAIPANVSTNKPAFAAPQECG